jgi:WD40 repeat protein
MAATPATVTGIAVWILGVCLSSGIGGEVMPLPPKPVYDPDEVVWLAVAGEAIYACQAKGDLACWTLAEGKKSWSVTLDGFNPATTQLFVAKSKEGAVLCKMGPASSGETVTEFLALPAMRSLWQTSKVSAGQGCGFSNDGKLFFCWSGMDEKVRVLDIEKKAVTRQIASPEAVQTGVEVFDDGRHSAFFGFKRLRLYGPDGKATASVANKKGATLQPLFVASTGGVACPYLFAFEENEAKNRFLALSGDGKIVWQAEGEWADLLAVAPDGKRVAWRKGGNVRISLLEDNSKAVEVKAPGDSEAHFSSDGKYLVLLPALEKGEVDGRTNKIRYARKGRIARILDAVTGKETGSINLDR